MKWIDFVLGLGLGATLSGLEWDIVYGFRWWALSELALAIFLVACVLMQVRERGGRGGV